MSFSTNSQLQVKICQTNDSDIKKILEIEKECGLARWSTDDYLLEIRRELSLMLTAKFSENIVGFLVGRIVPPEELDILNFGVLTNHQKQGIGGMLWAKLLDTALEKKIKFVWLEVRESNINAVKFYEKKGFVKVWSRKNFYTQPLEDAFVMKFEVRNAVLKLTGKT